MAEQERFVDLFPVLDFVTDVAHSATSLWAIGMAEQERFVDPFPVLDFAKGFVHHW